MGFFEVYGYRAYRGVGSGFMEKSNNNGGVWEFWDLEFIL